MGVAQRQHELGGLQAGHLRHHQRQQRVGGDVEGHAEEQVRAALVHLAGNPAVGHVELEQGVAGRQRHAVHVGRVPGADQVAARVGLFLQGIDHALDLVDLAARGRAPVAPLVAVDRAQLAVLVGPLVPDRHAALLQPFHVGVAAQEPQQLQDDRLEVQFLGGEQREAAGQVEAQLAAEHRACAGAGAVALGCAAFEDFREQIQVLALARRVRHTAMVAKSSRALWNRSSGFFASSRSTMVW